LPEAGTSVRLLASDRDDAHVRLTAKERLVSVRTSLLLATANTGAIGAGPSLSAAAAAPCGLDTGFGTNGILTAPVTGI
jgi:hypothetical protein